MNSFYTKLTDDKIRINWNKNPIRMETFLRFLTVPVVKSYDHLGASNGWTQYNNTELNLIISGGIVSGNEWLDTIQYKKRLQNPYNNYVSPFYIFDILTEEGKLFFVEYYRVDIDKLITEQRNRFLSAKRKLEKEKAEHKLYITESEKLYKYCKITADDSAKEEGAVKDDIKKIEDKSEICKETLSEWPRRKLLKLDDL